MKITKMPKLRNGSKGDSNPGSHDCESGILPLSYRAPHMEGWYVGWEGCIKGLDVECIGCRRCSL